MNQSNLLTSIFKPAEASATLTNAVIIPPSILKPKNAPQQAHQSP